MIKADEMRIGVPVPDAEIAESVERRVNGQCQCSLCGVHVRGPWYAAADVLVVRHWKRNSTAGTWRWYCRDRHEANANRAWKTDQLAPAELLP